MPDPNALIDALINTIRQPGDQALVNRLIERLYEKLPLAHADAAPTTVSALKQMLETDEAGVRDAMKKAGIDEDPDIRLLLGQLENLSAKGRHPHQTVYNLGDVTNQINANNIDHISFH